MSEHLREQWKFAAFDVSQLKPGDEVYYYGVVMNIGWSHAYPVYVTVVRVNPKTVTVRTRRGEVYRVEHHEIEGYTSQAELDEGL